MADKRWVTLSSKLPTRKDDPEKTSRQRMFSSWDANANGLLAITEIRNGLTKVLGADEVAALEADISDAFDTARGAKVSNNADGANYVEKSEFRLFFILLKRVFLGRYLDSIEAPKPMVGSWPTREAGMLILKDFTDAAKLLSIGWGVAMDCDADFLALDKMDLRAVSVGDFDTWARELVIAHDDVTQDDGPPPSEFELKMRAALSAGHVREKDLGLTAAVDLKTVCHTHGLKPQFPPPRHTSTQQH